MGFYKRMIMAFAQETTHQCLASSGGQIMSSVVVRDGFVKTE